MSGYVRVESPGMSGFVRVCPGMSRSRAVELRTFPFEPTCGQRYALVRLVCRQNIPARPASD
eukprot:1659945-Pyramimonas_sp.AAC.1